MPKANDSPPIWPHTHIEHWEKIRARGKMRFILSRAIPFSLGALAIVVVVCYFIDPHLRDEGAGSFLLLAMLWGVFAYFEASMRWKSFEEIYERSRAAAQNPPD